MSKDVPWPDDLREYKWRYFPSFPHQYNCHRLSSWSLSSSLDGSLVQFLLVRLLEACMKKLKEILVKERTAWHLPEIDLIRSAERMNPFLETSTATQVMWFAMGASDWRVVWSFISKTLEFCQHLFGAVIFTFNCWFIAQMILLPFNGFIE